MFSYAAYGLVIHSEIELPGLPDAVGEPDVRIVRETLAVDDLAARSNGGSAILGKVHDLLHFFAEDGRIVRVDAAESLEEGVIRTILLGTILATVLRQRGFLVLHAACVAKGDQAVAFVGYTGWGKSTTAEYFYQNGYRLLTDDVLALRVDETVEVVPGYPLIKLRTDAGEALRADFDALPMVHFDSSKRMHRTSTFDPSPVPLARIYLMRGQEAKANGIQPVTLQQAMIEIIGHTRLVTFLRNPEYMQRHLQQCSRLVSRVPVRALERVLSLDSLPEIKRLVEADLAGADVPLHADALAS